MFRNYLKIAWRNLLRNKVYSAINIGGLAVGMAVAMLIGLWVQHETSYDTFHANQERVGMIWRNTFFNGEKGADAAMPLPLYDELKDKYPDVKRISRIDWESKYSLTYGEAKISRQGMHVDPDFLSIFSFPLVNGSLASALTEPASIVLTEATAKALFGVTNPLGKIVRMNGQHDLRVTAIARDVPGNSTVQFDFLVSFVYMIQANGGMKEAQTEWMNNFLRTVVELREGVSMESFSAKIGPIIKQKSNDNKVGTPGVLFVHPLVKWHLRNEFKGGENVGGAIEYVRLFGFIGLFVLLIACINFMNLSTARSQQRAKEVGIRKAIGSQRGQLIGQFLSESLLTTALAFSLSVLLVAFNLPWLSYFGLDGISFDFTNLPLLLVVLVACILTGLLAGSYPALYLSSFVPVRVLKGTVQVGKGATLPRKLLVITQFAFSIALIISTIVVFRQIQYAKNRSLGYNPDNLISLSASDDLRKNYRVLKDELLNTGIVEAVARSSSPMTGIYNYWGDFSWPGKDPNSSVLISGIMTDFDQRNGCSSYGFPGAAGPGHSGGRWITKNSSRGNRRCSNG